LFCQTVGGYFFLFCQNYMNAKCKSVEIANFRDALIKHATGLAPASRKHPIQENQAKQASQRKKQETTCSLAEMSSQLIEDHRSGAEVHAGHELCERKSREFMVELGLPDGLLPLPTLDEVGYNRSTGFVWLRQAAGVTHTFDSIGKQVWYDKEVTAFVEPGRMHSLAGVKSKELLIWVTISEIVLSPSGTKIVFRTPAGLGRAFPVTAFQLKPAAEEEAAAAAAAN